MDELNPYQSPQADQESVSPKQVEDGETKSYARQKRNCLIFLIVWGMATGFLYVAAPEWEVVLNLIDAIIFAIAVIQWTSLRRGRAQLSPVASFRAVDADHAPVRSS